MKKGQTFALAIDVCMMHEDLDNDDREKLKPICSYLFGSDTPESQNSLSE